MDEQDYILIERYLQGECSPEEAATVAKRAVEEPAFNEALVARRQLNIHLQSWAGEENLRPTLRTLGERFFREETAVVRPLRSNRRWLYGIVAAAMIALAVIFAGPWLNNSGGYEQFAQHQPLSLTERGEDPANAAAAQQAYNNERYVEAIELLRAYLAQQSDDERARLALGVSLLETNRDEEAIAVFKRIAESQSTLAPNGNWYLALAAVKRGDNTAAVGYLDLIPASDKFLTAKANELRATL